MSLTEPFYDARLFKVETEATDFHIAGTLDGDLDFAIVRSRKTYQLTPKEARKLAAALIAAARDVEQNCL